LLGFKSRYQKVGQATGVPWFVIAAIHNRESDADFNTYLGNGEPLSRPTRLVPVGRGPFSSWEDGAIDALQFDKLDQVAAWSPERGCYELERYNGFGYRTKQPPVNSPYLWSFTNNYQSGKFVADGRFDPNFVDPQCGAVPIVKQIMAQDPSAVFPVAPAPPGPPAPLAIGSRGDRVSDLQTALQQAGFDVGNVDGIFGEKTRAAVTAFQQSAKLTATGVADDKTFQALAAKVGPQPAPINGAGPLRPPLQPSDVLRILLEQLGKVTVQPGAAASGGMPPGSQTGPSILQQILQAAFKPAAPTPPGAAPAGAATPTNGTPTPPVLTPIDQILGGQTLAGKKTALAIVAYAVMAILQAADVVTAGSPAGVIINTIIAAFGALGGISKIDRVIQTLGVIAAKPSG
jgi:lysozyme family protein/peptidoglycan hydrolase-like protein with peptidoglycan-binding domain